MESFQFEVAWMNFPLNSCWPTRVSFLCHRQICLIPSSGFPLLLSVLVLAMADNGISSSVSLFLLSSKDILSNMLISSSLLSKDNSNKSETFPSITNSIASWRLVFFSFHNYFLSFNCLCIWNCLVSLKVNNCFGITKQRPITTH